MRKKPKEHGAKLSVEGLAKGETLAGKRVVVVEDVTTTGGSAIKAVEAVKDAGGEIALVFTLVDREGAAETFRAAGLPFRAPVHRGRVPAADVTPAGHILATTSRHGTDGERHGP